MGRFDPEMFYAGADLSEGQSQDLKLQRLKLTLQKLVRDAGWTFLDLRDQFEPPSGSTVVVVGVVVWEPNGFVLLDALDSAAFPGRVIVFDLDDCMTIEQLERKLPGTDPPVQTPAAAVYERGDIVFAGQGPDLLEALPAFLKAEIEKMP